MGSKVIPFHSLLISPNPETNVTLLRLACHHYAWVLINSDGIVRKSIFGPMEGARQRLEYALLELFPWVFD